MNKIYLQFAQMPPLPELKIITEMSAYRTAPPVKEFTIINEN